MAYVSEILNIITAVFTLVAGTLTALWAYTKYVLERGFLPPVKFYVTGKKIGSLNNQNVIDIKIHLHNIGSTTLVARNIRLDIRYIRNNDQSIDLFQDRGRAGRLKFPHSLIKEMLIDASSLIPIKVRKNKRTTEAWQQLKNRGFLVLENDTFVQTGVDQVYTFTTMVPDDTVCYLTWCSFQYAQNLSKWQERLARFSRKIGLIQYTLKHVQEPHTVEDVFWIKDNASS